MYEHSNNKVILGIDVGGSHITAALINAADNYVINETLTRSRVEKDGTAEVILDKWMETILESISKFPAGRLTGIGFAMPGPFNYDEGISLMKGNNKYESLYNFNIAKFIRKQFVLEDDFPVRFENDAACFGLGESLQQDVCEFDEVIAVTLGTGFGAAFLRNNRILKDGDNVPVRGELYNQPYLDGIAEDYVSTAWLLQQYNQNNDAAVSEVKEIADRAIAGNDPKASAVFNQFGEHFAACILPWIKQFGPGCLVIGGSIAKSARLFISPLEQALARNNIQLKIKISQT